MKAWVLALALAAGSASAVGLAGSAAAGPFSDLVMAPGVLADVPAGPVFRYSHTRHLAARPEGSDPAQPEGGSKTDQTTGATAGAVPGLPPAVSDGRVIVTAAPSEAGMRLVLTRTEAGKTSPVAEFPARGPNPVLLFFLENTVRVIAAETGGSPFYLRNRIREALATAPLPATGETMVLHPFEADKNRDRMGAFATLSLRLTFDPAAPGRLVELKADTAAGAEGYTEILTLIAEE